MTYGLLEQFPQWCLWTIENDTKVPVDTAGKKINAHDPRQQMTYAEAVRTGGNLAFVFNSADPFFFIDLDDCLLPDGTGWTKEALYILSLFPGAFAEVSHSGRGLHIIGLSTDIPAHRCKAILPEITVELYTEKRFIALTGTNACGDPASDHTGALQSFVATYLPAAAGGDIPEGPGPVPEWDGPEDDGELLKMALRSRGVRSILNGKCSFKDLWTANEEALARSFPDSHGEREYDTSHADAALAQHLAFWTGKDSARIIRIMRQSALCREKWEREDYLPRTVAKAVSLQRDVYKKRVPTPATDAGTFRHEARRVTGFQYMTVDVQMEYFKGCVYVQDQHKIFIPSGDLLKQDQFNAMYGGYVFQLDEMGDKTTRKPWEAFTESQGVRFPKVHSTYFRPALPPGAVFEEDGRLNVNIYVPINTKRKTGDVTPFVEHVKKLLPDETDRRILLSYLAACVQHKGVKFQWSPLIQGVEGNGKTLLTRCVAFAIGERHTHMPPANEISEKFNDWLFYKLFIGIEDIYVPENKREIMEVLKPMVTNERLAMRAMYSGQIMGDNVANFVINSNHKDAIRKHAADRRFAIFYTAQQTVEDMLRDGMGGNYFPEIYAWLKTGGYEIVADYLYTYAIEEAYNPAGLCHRAPDTSSTGEAVREGLGGIEQDVLEAIAEGRSGFAGGWVSSVALDRLLINNRMQRALPQNKRKSMLDGIGYKWHPALVGGRANNVSIIDDGKKPVLFIRDDNAARHITNAAEIFKAYEKAQRGA